MLNLQDGNNHSFHKITLTMTHNYFVSLRGSEEDSTLRNQVYIKIEYFIVTFYCISPDVTN